MVIYKPFEEKTGIEYERRVRKGWNKRLQKNTQSKNKNTILNYYFK